MSNATQVSPAIRAVDESRVEIIMRWTNLMFEESNVTWWEFSMRVVRHYQQRFPPARRRIHFDTDGKPDAVARRNSNKLQRMVAFESGTHLPADLERSWVESLEQRYFEECRREIVREYGLLAVPLPDCPVTTDLDLWERLTHEFADSIRVVVPMLANEVFGPEDRKYIPAAIREIEQMMAAGAGLHARLTAEWTAILEEERHAKSVR